MKFPCEDQIDQWEIAFKIILKYIFVQYLIDHNYQSDFGIK